MFACLSQHSGLAAGLDGLDDVAVALADGVDDELDEAKAAEVTHELASHASRAARSYVRFFNQTACS